MPTPSELKDDFWASLKSDMTMMLGLVGVDGGHTRPMTAQIEGDGGGPIWFFTSRDNKLFAEVGAGRPAICTFTSKGHRLFAAIKGNLYVDNDPATIDRLWNRYVAAWFEQGKDDPKLALLRLDPESGEIWEDGSSLIAGIQMLFGADPKQTYKDNVAKVQF